MQATATATDIAAPAALSVAGVSHSFGSFKALDDVTLSIPSGSFTVLLGQNGAGKTTLFSLITRLYNNRSGAIHVYGFDVRRQPSAALARSADAHAEDRGESFIQSATSGEGSATARHEEWTWEEEGGPFVPTEASEEFAAGLDESNIAEATREALPTTSSARRLG